MLRNALIRRPLNPLATPDPLEAFTRPWFGSSDTPWFGNEWAGTPRIAWPQADLAEHEDRWTIDLDLPGMDKKDVEIRLERDVLTVRGERRPDESAALANQSNRVERWYGSFSRSFVLPRAAQSDDIVAKFANGVLSITVPKAAEAQPRQIAVH